MERNPLKRMRSDDNGSNHSTQTKVWVNQKMADLNDDEKMKAVHEKTNELLFKAANGKSTEKHSVENAVPVANNTAASYGGATSTSTTSTTTTTVATATNVSLCDQYQLMGDGTILVRDLNQDAVNPNLERRSSRCCQHSTFIHDICVNCTMDLCEECGYSCVECTAFICRACVTLFGNRPSEAEDPLCERCQMYCA
ncbi:uncharacterized protein LOC115629875 [Scaptodrosophila lebanonensis]|uniref:Uncharacterized protein LOC115629875 n=1 Tax=Drosophila lebanonensis TaxID=7225 RepID=A0A6J2U4D5_DROLE|nr:uncharacterized protein LOC115629875 [Scaptodrosophila lebanonensis]